MIIKPDSGSIKGAEKDDKIFVGRSMTVRILGLYAHTRK